jgi:23S rRNA (adenosine1067-2'-O)-methyltransferase
MSDESTKSDVAAPAAECQPEVIDWLRHPVALTIRQLLMRSEREQLQRILIDDEENIVQALAAGVTIESVFYAGDVRISNELQDQLPGDVRVYEVAKRTCKKLFEKEKVTRVFAIAHLPPPLPLKQLLATSGDLVVLEDLGISGNIGAIVRTAVAMGVGGLVLLNADHIDIYDRRLIRASRGFVFALPVVTATTDDWLGFCDRHGIPLLVTDAHGDKLVDEITSLSDRLAIVFGSEKGGVSAPIADAATLRIRIPMAPQVESLNVSAAAGITLYHRRQFNQRAPSGR